MKDERLIDLAIKLCKQSQHNYRMAAVIAKGSRIVSVGVNKNKTHPKQINPYTKTSGISIHAELDAIIGTPEDQLKGANIYIARRLVNGDAALAKPCICCQAILREAGIKNIIYTIDKETTKKERLS